MAGFTVTWVVLGYLNEGYILFGTVIEDYSPIHQPISGLGLGSTAAAMNAAFVVYGAIALAGALAASRVLARIDPALRRPAAISLGLHGLGSMLVGVFTLESMALHSLGFLLVLAPILGFVPIGRGLARHSHTATFGRLLVWFAVPLSVLLLVAFFVSFDPDVASEGSGVGGLAQRALIINLQVWVAALVVAHRFRARPRIHSGG